MSCCLLSQSSIWNSFGNSNVKLYSKFKRLKTIYRWLWSRWAFKYWMDVCLFFCHCFVLPVVKSKTFREPFTSRLASLFLFEKQDEKVRFLFVCTLCTLTRYTVAWEAFSAARRRQVDMWEIKLLGESLKKLKYLQLLLDRELSWNSSPLWVFFFFI